MKLSRAQIVGLGVALAALYGALHATLAQAAGADIPARDPSTEIIEAVTNNKYNVHLYVNSIEDHRGRLVGLRVFGTGDPDNWPERIFSIKELRISGSEIESPTKHVPVISLYAEKLDDVPRKDSKSFSIMRELVLGIQPLFQIEQLITIRQDDEGHWAAFHDGQRVNYLETTHMIWENRE